METAIRISQQKHEHNLFNTQKASNWFHHNTKRGVRTIKIQIYKNMKIL